MKKDQEGTDDMYQLYQQGLSVTQIAEQFGVCSSAVSARFRRAKLPMRKTKACLLLDETYFDVIDTEEKAYWLGFLGADGNVYGNKVQVALKKEDLQHLEKFARALGLQRMPKLYARSRVRDDGSLLRWEEAVLQFKSVHMVRSLHALGVVERKSLTFIPPVLREDLQRHFWRGYVDGNGSIPVSERYGASRTVLEVSTGSQHVSNAFVAFARISGVAVRENFWESYHLWRVSVEGCGAQKLIHELYHDATVFLERKYLLTGNAVESQEDPMREISVSVAKAFIQEHHYLKSLPIGVTTYGWIESGVLKAVAAIGTPSSPGVANITGVHAEVSELRRLCIVGAHKNDASKFISRIVKKYFEKFPQKNVIVSYADTGVGHEGIAYRAANALYFGTSEPEMVAVLPSGERITQGMIRGRKDLSALEGAKVEISQGKRKYAFIRQDSDVKSRLRWPVQSWK